MHMRETQATTLRRHYDVTTTSLVDGFLQIAESSICVASTEIAEMKSLIAAISYFAELAIVLPAL